MGRHLKHYLDGLKSGEAVIKQEIEIVQEETCEDVTEEKCVNFEVSFFPHIFHLFFFTRIFSPVF